MAFSKTACSPPLLNTRQKFTCRFICQFIEVPQPWGGLVTPHNNLVFFPVLRAMDFWDFPSRHMWVQVWYDLCRVPHGFCCGTLYTRDEHAHPWGWRAYTRAGGGQNALPHLHYVTRYQSHLTVIRTAVLSNCSFVFYIPTRSKKTTKALHLLNLLSLSLTVTLAMLCSNMTLRKKL